MPCITPPPTEDVGIVDGVPHLQGSGTACGPFLSLLCYEECTGMHAGNLEDGHEKRIRHIKLPTEMSVVGDLMGENAPFLSAPT
jgi:hypothetical protein